MTPRATTTRQTKTPTPRAGTTKRATRAKTRTKGDAEPVVIDLTTDRLVPTSEAARLTGLSAKRLRDYRCDRTGPAFLKMGTSEQARCLYRLSDLERWIQENARPMGG